MKKIVLFFLGLIVLAVGGGLIYWYTMDTTALRNQLTAFASKKLGRELTIAGELSPSFSLSNGFGLTINGVSLANAKGYQPANMLQLDEMELVVNPLALLDHQLHVKKIVLRKAEAYMESRGTANNWTFADAVAEDTTVTAPTGSDAPPMKVSVDSIEVEDVNLAKITDGKRQDYKVRTLTASAQADKPVSFKADALIDGQEIKADVTAGTIEEIQSGQQQVLNATIVYGPHTIDVKANYRRNGDTHMLKGAQLEYNGIKAAGDVSVNMAGSVPNITADLKIPELDTAKFKSASGAPAAGGAGAASSDEYVFPRTPLPWGVLNTVTANAQIDIGMLKNDGKDFGPVNVQALLKGGDLAANVTTQPPGATQPITAKINASSGKSVSIAARAPRLEPSLLFGWMGNEPILQAPASFTFDFAGRGESLHDVMATSNGQAVLEFAPGTINAKVLPMSVEGALATLVGLDQIHGAKMACTKVDFNIVNGVANARGIGVDSTVLISAGEGSINLGAETVNMRLVAEPLIAVAKGARFPIYVKGSLKRPITTADTGAVSAQIANAAAGKAIKLIGSEKIAGIADQWLGASKQKVADNYIAMPFNPCRPTDDVDKKPEPVAAPAAAVPPTAEQPAPPPRNVKEGLEQMMNDPSKLLNGLLGGGAR